MAQQLINLGTTANDGTGDPIRVAGTKINSNFTELYSRQPYSLPTSTSVVLGGVKIGDTVQINPSTGVLNINASFDNLNDVQIQNPLVNHMIRYNGSQWVNSPFKCPSVTTVERDALAVIENGMVIYNSSVNKFQGLAGGVWVDLH